MDGTEWRTEERHSTEMNTGSSLTGHMKTRSNMQTKVNTGQRGRDTEKTVPTETTKEAEHQVTMLGLEWASTEVSEIILRKTTEIQDTTRSLTGSTLKGDTMVIITCKIISGCRVKDRDTHSQAHLICVETDRIIPETHKGKKWRF